MQLAIRYLSGTRTQYEILASDRNIFKNFPVNWRYDDGRGGGMMVLRNSRFNADTGLESLLRDQAKWCKGSSKVDRQPTRGNSGQRLARARGECRTNGRTVGYDYSVAELSDRRVMLIIEAVSARSRQQAQPQDSRRSGQPDDSGLGSNPFKNEPSGRTPRRDRAVAPNEL